MQQLKTPHVAMKIPCAATGPSATQKYIFKKTKLNDETKKNYAFQQKEEGKKVFFKLGFC